MAKPTDSLEWGTSVSAEISEPSTGQKQTGWVHGTRPPASRFNWWQRAVYRWVDWYNTVLATDDAQTVFLAGQAAATRETFTVTTAATNKGGIKGTGNGTGAGVSGIGGATGVGVLGTGGATSGAGVSGVGTAGNAVGVQGQGQGSGSGVTGTGGATSGAVGVLGTGGSTNGIGVKGLGVGTGVGGYFDGQGDGSAATDDAVEVAQNIKFSGTATATGNIGFTNRLTKKLFPKAIASFVTNSSASPTKDSAVNENISSVTATSTYIEVTFAQAILPGLTAYFQVEHCPAGTGSFVRFARAYYQSNTKIRIEIRDTSFAIVDPTSVGASGEGYLLVVWGVQ